MFNKNKCISLVLYFGGFFDVFLKQYEHHECKCLQIKSVDLDEVSASNIKTDNGILRWFVVNVVFFKMRYKIITNLVKYQMVTDFNSAISNNSIKCLLKGPASIREQKLKKIAGYNGKCKIENINKWNNSDEIKKIN